MVGQRPFPYNNINGSGAGGSFVINTGSGKSDYVLVAAGGGGGGWNKSDNNETAKKIRDASTEESGQNSADGKAGGQHRCF